jgi:hypothetical protein
MGGRGANVSPPVGRFVGRIYERTFSPQCPLVPLPTYIGGWDESGRGRRGCRCQGSRVRGARAVSDRRCRGGLDLRVKKGYRAGTSRGGESEGDTRCSHRDCRGDRKGG